MRYTSIGLFLIVVSLACALAFGDTLPGNSNRAGTAVSIAELADGADDPIVANAMSGVNPVNLSPGFLVLLDVNDATSRNKDNFSDVIFFGGSLSITIGGKEVGCKQTNATNKNCVVFWSDSTWTYGNAGQDIRDAALNPTGAGFSGFAATQYVPESVFGSATPTGNAVFPGNWQYKPTNATYTLQSDLEPVPEPSTLILFSTVLLAVVGRLLLRKQLG